MAVDYKSIGDRVKRYRMDKRMSQEDLGEKVELTGQHISNIERGYKGISLEKVVDIANVLDVSADDILTDSLKHSSSPVSTEIQDILLDCNYNEKEMLTRTIKFMKALFAEFGI